MIRVKQRQAGLLELGQILGVRTTMPTESMRGPLEPCARLFACADEGLTFAAHHLSHGEKRRPRTTMVMRGDPSFQPRKRLSGIRAAEGVPAVADAISNDRPSAVAQERRIQNIHFH